MTREFVSRDLTWAKIDLFTIVDRIEICLFDGFDEFIDTEHIAADVTEESEKTRTGLVYDSIAQIATGINDADLKNNIEQDIDQFIEGIDALWTPIDCLVGRIEWRNSMLNRIWTGSLNQSATGDDKHDETQWVEHLPNNLFSANR